MKFVIHNEKTLDFVDVRAYYKIKIRKNHSIFYFEKEGKYTNVNSS